MSHLSLAAGIFMLTYVIIVSEHLHRTAAALVGGILMVLLGVVSQEEAFHAIDLNVIFLLVGMMMIAYLLGETGIFQWFAIKAVHKGKGNPVVIMAIIAVISAISSALLDNVTVVVLIAPVTLLVASTLAVSPVPFLITVVMASNIGGATTLIGDPPNVLIASAAGIEFLPFIMNMGPPTLFAMMAFLPMVMYHFNKQMHVSPERRQAVMRLKTEGLIRNRVLLIQCLAVLALVLVGFTLHGWLNLKPATIALAGATLLLVWTRRNPSDILEHVEWSTLMFFVGLFVTVEALVQVGLIDRLARSLLQMTEGNLDVTTFFILWFSALASGIVDNIPYTAAMIPLVERLSNVIPVEPLWWALALGADLGGNLTLVGASANIIVATLAERSGYKLSFGMFLRYGIVTVFMSLVIASIWIWFRYLLPCHVGVCH